MLDIIPNWHPILVHFTVAFISSLGLLQVALWLKPKSEKLPELFFMQQILMVVSTISVVLTVFTGWLAFNSVAHDTPSHLAMTDHRNWALGTAGVFLVSSFIYFIRPNMRTSLVGVLLIASASLVAITGFKGGEVVYRYGLGVMSLPEVSAGGGDGHDHEHGGSEAGTMEDGHGGHESMEPKNEEHGDHQHGNKPDVSKIKKTHKNDGHSH